MVKHQPRSLDRTFGALADPTRRRILQELAKGDRTVGELAAPFRVSLPAVSRHIRVLRRAGLLKQTRRGRDRPCKLDPSPLKAADAWMEKYRRFWEDQLDALEQLLAEEQITEQKGKS